MQATDARCVAAMVRTGQGCRCRLIHSVFMRSWHSKRGHQVAGVELWSHEHMRDTDLGAGRDPEVEI